MKEPSWILQQTALSIHDVLLAESGGALGIRNEPLLESALARPRNLWSYEKPNLFRLAAAYTHGIVKNHPFVDGNKRTAYVVGGIFLERNGHKLNATEEEAFKVIMGLASNHITEEVFAEWLENNCQ